MDDPRVNWLVDLFKRELRQDDGLTTGKMRKQPELMKLLVDDGPAEDATAALREIVLSMGDGEVARTVRNSLVISNGSDGIEARSGPQERRRWATGAKEYGGRLRGELLVSFSVRTHDTKEEEGFCELAKLILDRSDRRGCRPTEEGLLQENSTGQGGDEAGHASPSLVADSTHQVTAAESLEMETSLGKPEGRAQTSLLSRIRPLDRHRLSIRIGAVGAVALVTLTLLVTAMIPRGQQSSSATDNTSPARPPRATVSGSAAPNIDNTRGWGPPRQTFTMQHPAPYPVFNSITDNPVRGDERNFVQCKDTAKDGQSWADELVAMDGHTYQCYLWVDNDVAPNLDSSADGAGGNVAAKLQNARVRISYPGSPTYNPGLVGILSADNAPQVWDSCNFVAPRPVSLRYVLASARLYTVGTPKEGQALPGAADVLTHDPGALLGDKGDGLVGQNAGYLLFDIKITLS